MSNRKTLLVAFIVGIIVIIFHFSVKKQPTDKEVKEVVGLWIMPFHWREMLAPSFEIELLNGERFSLSDNIGKKIIIINFFATWCAPCKEEIPELNRFYEKHKEEQFILIGIAYEEEDKIKNFIKEHKIGFPVGIDKDGNIQKMFTVRGIPTTIFIGVNGKICFYEVGQIMNADIAFDCVYKMNMELIKKGKAITKEAYLQRLKEQNLKSKKDDKGG